MHQNLRMQGNFCVELTDSCQIWPLFTPQSERLKRNEAYELRNTTPFRDKCLQLEAVCRGVDGSKSVSCAIHVILHWFKTYQSRTHTHKQAWQCPGTPARMFSAQLRLRITNSYHQSTQKRVSRWSIMYWASSGAYEVLKEKISFLFFAGSPPEWTAVALWRWQIPPDTVSHSMAAWQTQRFFLRGILGNRALLGKWAAQLQRTAANSCACNPAGGRAGTTSHRHCILAISHQSAPAARPESRPGPLNFKWHP